jgi:hypothetical protein
MIVNPNLFAAVPHPAALTVCADVSLCVSISQVCKKQFRVFDIKGCTYGRRQAEESSTGFEVNLMELTKGSPLTLSWNAKVAMIKAVAEDSHFLQRMQVLLLCCWIDSLALMLCCWIDSLVARQELAQSAAPTVTAFAGNPQAADCHSVCWPQAAGCM